MTRKAFSWEERGSAHGFIVLRFYVSGVWLGWIMKEIGREGASAFAAKKFIGCFATEEEAKAAVELAAGLRA